MLVAAALIAWIWFAASDRGASTATPSDGSSAPATSTGAPRSIETSNGKSDGTRTAKSDVSSDADEAVSFAVHGRVVDSDDRHGLRGATIALREADGDEIAQTSSDADGAYRVELRGDAPRSIDVVASLEDWTSVIERARATNTPTNECTIDFVLRRGFTVEGVVRAAEGGAPIVGAQLRVFAKSEAFADAWQDDLSDDSGAFRMEDVTDLPRNELELVVLAEGFAPLHLRELELPADSDVLHVEAKLAAAARVRGRVIDAAKSTPIADARVSCVALDDEFVDGGGEIRTDADGEFDLALSDLALEDASIVVRADGFLPMRMDRTRSESQPLSFALQPALKLHGSVIDARTKQPIAFATVRLTPAQMPIGVAEDFEDSTVTKSDGTFEIGIENAPSGAPCTIAVEADGWSSGRETLMLDAARAALPVQIELEHTLVVHGRIRRVSDGSPVIGATVRVIAKHRSRDLSCESEEDGAYRIEFSPAGVTAARLAVEFQGRRFELGALDLGRGDAHEITKNIDLDAPPAEDLESEPSESERR